MKALLPQDILAKDFAISVYLPDLHLPSTPTMLLQSQQRLKREADKARQLAAEQEDELASTRERMEHMQAELKGVKDAAREQLLELEQLKTVQCSPFVSKPFLQIL